MDFNNKPYIEKRDILREYYINNSEAHRIVKKLAIKIRSKLRNPVIDILDIDLIIKYLIDGYLAFEVGFYSGFIEIDPETLTISFENLKLYWIQNMGTDEEMKMPHNEVIYISYDYHEISFLCSIYTGLIDIKDEDFILDHVDFIVDKLSTKKLDLHNVLNIDKIIKRGIKIQKIKNYG